jgi:hypothetical protein
LLHAAVNIKDTIQNKKEMKGGKIMSSDVLNVIFSIIWILICVFTGVKILIQTKVFCKIPNAIKTKGTIASIDWDPYHVRRISDTGYDGLARVKYVVDAKEYYVKTTYTSQSFKENMVMYVKYSKNNPSLSVIIPRFRDVLWGIVIISIGIIGPLILFLIF